MKQPLPIMKGKYVSGKMTKAAGSKLAAHLKYNQYRKLGPEETREDRHIFSQENDHIYRQDAVHDIADHTANYVLYHKIILSPAEHEHIEDFRQWTRDIMRALEERKGAQLHWYAVVQAHPRQQINEPHVHLVLAGGGEDLKTSAIKLIRMDANDYAFLREQGREHSNFDFYQVQEQELQDLDDLDDTPFTSIPPHSHTTSEHDMSFLQD